MRFAPPGSLAAGCSAPPSAPIRLLALPRELCDIIYEYALTENEGLVMVERHRPNDTGPKSFKGCRPSEPSVESNRLKYVCRQLYQETKGLKLGLNDLTIHSEREVENFAAFLHTCSVDQEQCIREVTLCSRALTRDLWEPAIDILEPYDASHPKMKFNLYLSAIDLGLRGSEWICEAGLILYEKHGHVNHALVPPDLCQLIPLSTLQDRPQQIPDNIRMFPGKGPGYIVKPVFTNKDMSTWGLAQVRLSQEGLERWQLEGF
ncbi:hypothetical protein BKA58DRAFT_242468 [Alternaria rosae]|uniref:uncharacterized protein n=1 Tax=Alternaria rosae TaxID=1187941 RepID=UPI001E8E7D12|nr:uncharacterized protein BKA58DRAFT_242468 [Alternaria rosae]KAH6865292.1 hypothetical protein BKA58DRAFT_242468 [Alternaria rosae]